MSTGSRFTKEQIADILDMPDYVARQKEKTEALAGFQRDVTGFLRDLGFNAVTRTKAHKARK